MISFNIKELNDLTAVAQYLVELLKPNIYLILRGELGAGKTTLTKFLARELEIEANVSSPTFNVLQQYWSNKKQCYLNHFDFFKLKEKDDLNAFKELTEGNINVIEWPDKNSSFWLGEETIEITINYLKNKPEERTILLS